MRAGRSSLTVYDLERLGRHEAHRELVGLLDDGKLAGLPAELFADHLVAGYANATWPVLCDAAMAVLWRFAAARRERVEVVERPVLGAWRGVYRVCGCDGEVRRVAVWSISPVRVSCDCADYARGSLGLCEHGAAVCLELAERPEGLGPALRAQLRDGPGVGWEPIRSLQGPGHWLEGVRVRPGLVTPSQRPWLEPCDPPLRGEPAWLRLRAETIEHAPRAEVVEAIEGWVERSPMRDLALSELLSHERDALRRCEALAGLAPRLGELLQDFTMTLYPHQRLAVRRFLGSGRMLLADDMGLGKTVQATAVAHVLCRAGLVQRVLILAPASLKGQWVREWRRASAVPIENLDGPADARHRRLEATTRGVVVANYELLLRDRERLQRWAPQLVVLDEAQRIKNATTQTAQRAKELDPTYRLALTGTPIENRLAELASIMEWIDPRALAPMWQLPRSPGEVFDRTIGVPHLRTLRDRLEPLVLRRTRAEILPDLPEREDRSHSVPMTTPQQFAHNELDRPIAVLLRLSEKRALTRAEFIRLMTLLNTQRMHANGLGQSDFERLWPLVADLPPDDEVRAILEMPKLDVWRSLVESIVLEQGRKLVVFSQWRRTLVLANWAASDLLQAAGVRSAFFTGAESPKRRTHNVVDFHDEPDVRVLLSTDAGGVGLNLQRAASHCVLFELPWNPAVLEQRVARVHRLGQTEPVQVHTLVSQGSIENRIALSLGQKQALFDDVFGDSADSERPCVSFLSRVRAIVDPPVAPTRPSASAAGVPAARMRTASPARAGV